MKPLSQSLNDAINRFAPEYVVSDNAPNSFRELKYWREHNPGEPIPVYSGGSADTIYGDETTNYAFRALHDTTHLRFNLPFTLQGELRVAEIQRSEFRLRRVSRDDCELLFADVAGQIRYYYRHRKFVVRQREFVQAYLRNPESALCADWS